MCKCPPLIRITLGPHKSDINNQMMNIYREIRYNGTDNIWLQLAADSIIRDPIKNTLCKEYPIFYESITIK